MKKLMIAAVAAAMAGVVLADYNFSATLKTTQGRKGTDTLTTLNLGKNGAAFWYDDANYATLAALAGGYWATTKIIDGVPVNTIKKTTTKDGTVASANGAYLLNGSTAANYAAAVALLKTLAAAYPERSMGRYCETVMVVDPAQCYRIAGTKRIDQNFRSAAGDYTDCCTAIAGVGPLTLGGSDVTLGGPTPKAAVPVVFDNGLTTIAYETTQLAAPQALDETLYQRFGGQTSRAANRVEIYAAVPRARTTDGATFAGWIAGQGTVRSTTSATPMDANTISGNIVGILTAPVCENCCTAPTVSVAFDCVNAAAAVNLPYSAAYGTFHLRWVR